MIDTSKTYKCDLKIDEAKSELDLLFKSVKSYRTSKHFRELIDICRRFRYLAPFNAMMVEIQRPGADMVLTSSQWKRLYRRRIKPNARPVVVLTYNPVSYLFDLSDTEPIGDASTKTEKILEEIKHQYDLKQEVKEEDLRMLEANLSVVGIAYTDKFRAGNNYGAQLLTEDNLQKIQVQIRKGETIDYESSYLISVNENLSIGAKYSSIMHELGHFFCHHLPAPKGFKKWDVRQLSHEAEEFEAQSVAWLTCQRLGIDNSSEFYLATYLDNNEEIPEGISVDHIFKAHNEIWKLLFVKQNATNNYLYNHDEAFKERVRERIGRNK